jgi:hypothetical protein
MSADQPLVKNALSNSKLSLTAPHPDSKTGKCLFRISIWNNNPRAEVIIMDNMNPDPKKKFIPISANLDCPTFYSFLEFFKRVVASKDELEYTIECKGHEYINGEKAREITTLSNLTVGKDASGYVYIKVVSTDKTKPVIKFIVSSPDRRYVTFRKGNGDEFTKVEASNAAAAGWIKTFEIIVGNLLATSFVPAPPFVPGGNKNYGKRQAEGNRGQQGSGSSNRQEEMSDDDLPF